MEKYLETGIKDIITEFPEVGKILEEYDIGCVPCNVGTCLLKDIVGIHNLSEEEEQVLLKKIAAAIYPGKKVAIPKIERDRKSKSGINALSPPLKRLVDEHVLIKRLIALIPKMIDSLDVETETGREMVSGSVNFIRSYADKYHHAKEEDILFGYFDPDLDILNVMLEDHENARNHVKAIVEALDNKDGQSVAEHLEAYHDLLTEHIKREDEILYPWMDRNLSDHQIGELFSKFNSVEENTEKAEIEICRKFVETMENKFNIERKE